MELSRCPWCLGDEEYTRYHDEEWGVPQRDGLRLFEMLILEGAQAGLSWLTVLRRRTSYREAFDRMEPEKIARYGETDVARLMKNPGIIRNERKIRSAVGNAKSYLALQERHGSFSRWLWNWVEDAPLVNRPRSPEDIPPSTPLSALISKELRAWRFSFAGPVIVYAFMQAVGMVDDHLASCYRAGAGAPPPSSGPDKLDKLYK
ncbi:MAG: DNA-3-methyladenine glycosylase I [Spirochaetaceae bacterium]|jgi:DNA-3-methyladenine glycosylase I|nr:DNA-3-methyladenine glycosylase I [Spirochaetaceae bacterium]